LQNKRVYLLLWIIVVFCFTLVEEAKLYAGLNVNAITLFQQTAVKQKQDSIKQDSIKADSVRKYLPSKRTTYQEQDRYGDPFSSNIGQSPFLLGDPAALSLDVEIDTGLNYTIYEKIGDINFRPTSSMTFDEFSNYQEQEMLSNYWRERSLGLDGESAVSGRSLIPPLYVSPAFDRLFGGSFVEIIPNGFVTLDFGGRFTKNENPNIPPRSQRYSSFEFNPQINMNAVGKVGEKLAVTANFANNNSFDFQNDLKVEYTGYEEEIIKKIEIGNVSMPVNNSLISGAQNLFGIKTQLQFGHLYVTSVASTQRGTSESITVSGGKGQRQEFEVRSSDYDENRHFFLGHFFRDNYESWLGGLPNFNSGVNVTRVEVFVIDRTQNTNQQRRAAAFMDLGEANPVNVYRQELLNGTPVNSATNNEANSLWEKVQALDKNYDAFVNAVDGIAPALTRTEDYEIVNVARKLDENEYTFHQQLGYVSLQRQLQNDEMLAVSFEFSYNGQRYSVGELSETYGARSDEEVAIFKLLRPSRINVDVPSWDLMMKNVYNLPGNQITEDGFQLRIIYRDDRTGQDNPSLHESSLRDIPLLRLFNLDSLNQNGDPQPDGNFDYIKGVTIDERNGRIVFPVLEPFGQGLNDLFTDEEQTFRGKYVFSTLYQSTKNDAQQLTSKDKFFIKGQYANGSSTEIALPGINISPESVVVSSGGTQLTPNIDYRVEPNLGRVTILNQGILNSGRDLIITFEREDLFNFQSKSLIGTRFDYVVSEKINFGATILRHTQRPLGVSRYSIGSEPTNNTKWGLDINYSDEVPFLTKAVDLIPFIDTKAPSSVTFRGEFAQLIPGVSNEVNGEGASYIDDFEQSVTLNNLGSDISSWNIASTPETTDNKFAGMDVLGVNNKRAKLAWYQIEQAFYVTNGLIAPNIPESSLQNHYSRIIPIQEIYKNRDRTIGSNRLPTFDLAYFPAERGMYNFATNLTTDGKLTNPAENWGGITRAISSEVDFDKSNIEYIEFWLLDPFIATQRGQLEGEVPVDQSNNSGKLIFNLGSISEDILPDKQLSFENGLPEVYEDTQNVQVTAFGRVPTEAPINEAFSNQDGARENQDIGLDGIKNSEEAAFYDAYVQAINANPAINASAKAELLADPAGDNFQYFFSDAYDSEQTPIIQRYKKFNNYEGNTPISSGNQAFNPAGSRTPDSEDLNNDRTVATLEQYYQYDIDLNKNSLNVADNPFIVDEAVSEEEGVKWYLFRVPIRKPTSEFGGISGFKSIRYIRTVLTGFQSPVVLRMADFRLVGSQWREYQGTLSKSGISETPESKDSELVVSVVSVEANSENGVGKVPYRLPPGIQRDQDISATANQVRQNEQSIQLCVSDFEDGEAIAAFKNINFDLVNYGTLKMFLHAQSQNASDDEIRAFVRLGTDFDDNYYEIELPLKVTPYQSIDPQVIWPNENEIDLAFDKLYQLKSRRNRLQSNVTLPFSEEFGKYTLTVRGRPDMSSVQTVMIGMRNPRGGGSSPKDICIWANEMRVTDFDQTSGYAANASLNTQLADFANISTSARYTSVGFGGIEQNIAQRTRETSAGFDVSANISLGKFFKEESGIKIPMYLGYQTFEAVPFFDPRDPDIPLKSALLSFTDDDERENYRNIVVEQEKGRSINFTNVRKERKQTEKLAMPFAISNFDFTYAYSEFSRSNLQTAAYETRDYRGAIGYNYAFPNTSITPFKSSEAFNSPYLKLIKDINFNPLPASFGMRAELNRTFVKTQFRNSDLTTAGIDPQFEKNFTMNRTYNLNWNLTESLNLNYAARAFAIIDEAPGAVDSELKRDSIITNLQNLGRMKNYDQSIVAGYTLPFSKIPFTDWISSDLRYKVDFSWTSGSLGQIDSLGHIIQNAAEYGANGRLDMNKLYNKVKLFNTINNPPRLRAGQKDTTFQQPGGKAIKGLLKLLMSVKNITGSYSMRGGTLLPGYRYRPFLLGLDSSFTAPGAAFLLGSQDPTIKNIAAENDWLTKSSSQNAFFTQSTVETINIKAILEPAKDLNIQLEFSRMANNSFQENFRYVNDTVGFESFTPFRSGNYSMTYNMVNTAFVKSTVNNAPLFEQFMENKALIKERLEAINQVDGVTYRLNQQDVLIPAFLAAYSGKESSTVSLNPVPKIPLPNWRVDYKGLSNIQAIKDIFPSVTISHSYVSTFSVNSYRSNSIYDSDGLITLDNDITDYPLPTKFSEDNYFLPVYNIETILLTEKFSPLIGISLRTKGRFTAKAEYRKERNLSLSTTSAQLTDQQSNDFVIDIGFTDPSFKLPFKVKGRVVSLKNDLTMQMSLTVRNTVTVQRSVDDGTSTIVNGDVNFQLRPTVNYTVNERLNLNFYYQRSFNEPKLTNSFPSTNTTFGVQVRFGLQ
jgi:cell surface protein SprA